MYSQGDIAQGSTYGIVGYNKKGKPIYGHMALPPGAGMQPPPPPPIQPIQAPLDLQSQNRSRLTTQSRARKQRAKAAKGKSQLTVGLNTGAMTGQEGGVSF